MKKVTLLLLVVNFFIGVMAQDEWSRKETFIFKTKKAPVMDAEKDADVYTGETFNIESWVNGNEPVADVEGKFWYAYDNEYLYVFSTLKVPTKNLGGDEVGLVVALDAEDYTYNWEVDPKNDNGAIFSKAVFGGSDETWSVAEDEAKTIREFEYIWISTTDGYAVEVRVPWANLSTNADVVSSFKSRGTLFFDIGYKLEADDEKYFAFSNNDNNIWQKTDPAAIVTLAETVRKSTSIKKTSTAPAIDGDKDDAYPGDGYDIATWVSDPVANVEGKFWLTYDDNNLYVYSTLATSTLTAGGDEVGLLVAIDPQDVYYHWEVEPKNENGAIFSKAVFGGDDATWSVAADQSKTIREYEYFWTETTEGYAVEIKLPWASLTTDANMVSAFKDRGTFFFDIGYKLAADDAKYVAYSNTNNSLWKETTLAGIVSLEGVNSINNKLAINTNVYPVPANQYINIKSAKGIVSAEIFDISGKSIEMVQLNGQDKIDISFLNKGLFIVRFNYASGQTGLAKIIKE